MTSKGKKLTKEMEKQQELELAEAQNIVISEDLVVAGKRQLQFLAEVDRNRHLYDDHALDRAIYRYKYCWLPLLAKHEKSQLSEGPLVVPLDCEWVWHCHRLNPVRYKADCEALFGTILGIRDVVSSVYGSCKDQTVKIWNQMYPNEPYELDLSSQFSKDVVDNVLVTQQSTNYDLVAAVKRQSTFFHQVSRPHMTDDRFLEEAVARYKGFLHLIKRNQERSIRQFCVPTYDIDLIWHSHQLNPTSYCKDMVALIGNVLQHDDTDSDRSKGKKLDTGFSGTSKQWEDTFGTRYWKAGAMRRCNTPSPLTFSLSNQDTMTKKIVSSNENENMIRLPKKMLVEVMLEIVEVRDLPDDDKGSLFVTIDKKMLDSIFKTRRRLNISSETGQKQVTVFQCEPNGVLIFELLSYGQRTSPGARFAKSLGTTSISLQNLMNPVSQLSVEKWFDIVPISRGAYAKPISMRIALSFTSPVAAPYVLKMAPACPFSSSCFFPLSGKYQQAKSWACFVDETGNEIINIQMRYLKHARNNSFRKQEVIGITKNRETHVLAESAGTGWSLMDSKWKLQLDKKYSKDDNIIELIGSRKVVVIPGRKLEYETKKNEKHSGEHDFMTAVEISADYPYGKAAALLNLKSEILKVCYMLQTASQDDELWLTSIILMNR
ncbi:glycine-rich domain-containing protein 2-like [Tripterygium wilfordii]|uniref:glycine-rich domain-containing protein 2-like n=1 Tax=Tripterygium wilfordii TaxID=458696 RepID=UPI0018F84DF9|nr:glycine-rich domain-containing protein 2-like [Tripterygium wilfordii]